jgi:hypothetical protein
MFFYSSRLLAVRTANSKSYMRTETTAELEVNIEAVDLH